MNKPLNKKFMFGIMLCLGIFLLTLNILNFNNTPMDYFEILYSVIIIGVIWYDYSKAKFKTDSKNDYFLSFEVIWFLIAIKWAYNGITRHETESLVFAVAGFIVMIIMFYTKDRKGLIEKLKDSE